MLTKNQIKDLLRASSYLALAAVSLWCAFDYFGVNLSVIDDHSIETVEGFAKFVFVLLIVSSQLGLAISLFCIGLRLSGVPTIRQIENKIARKFRPWRRS